MKLKVMTPKKVLLEDDVESVTLPTMSGQITVLDGHDILVTILTEGELHFRKEVKGEITGKKLIKGGVAEVTGNKVSVFTEGL